jgi:hypothetical protein
MAYSGDDIQGRVIERSVPVASTEYHDRVRWGPIFSGLVIAISTQLVLSALGAAIGLTSIAGSGAPRTDASGTGTAVGIWSIISLLIALFVGGWITARACGRMNRSTALLNGAILWATTLAVSAWLVSSGISGAFGIAASNAGEVINQVQQPGGPAVPDPGALGSVTAEEARNIASNAAKVGWGFTLGSLLGLVATLIGASVGVRTPSSTSTTYATDRPYTR